MGFSRQEYWSGLPLPSPASGMMQSQFHEVKGISACGQFQKEQRGGCKVEGPCWTLPLRPSCSRGVLRTYCEPDLGLMLVTPITAWKIDEQRITLRIGVKEDGTTRTTGRLSRGSYTFLNVGITWIFKKYD